MPTVARCQDSDAIDILKATYESARQEREQVSGIVRPNLDYELLCARFLGEQRWAPYIRAIVDTVYDYRAGHRPMGLGAHRRETVHRAAKAARSLAINLAQIDLRELVTAISASHRGEGAPASAGNWYEEENSFARRNMILSASQPMRLDEIFLLRMLFERLSTGLNRVAETIPVSRHRPKVPDPLQFGCEMLRDRWHDAHDALPSNSIKKGTIGEFALLLFGPQGLGFAETEVATALEHALHTAKDRPDAD